MATFDRDRWVTPATLVPAILSFFGGQPALDPYWDPSAHIRPRLAISVRQKDAGRKDWGRVEHGDGHVKSWHEYDSVWVQPPYSRGNPPRALQKAAEYSLTRPDGALVALVNASPGSRYWRNHVFPRVKAIAWPLRLAFERPDTNEPVTGNQYDQAILLYAGDVARFAASFGGFAPITVPFDASPSRATLGRSPNSAARES